MNIWTVSAAQNGYQLATEDGVFNCIIGKSGMIAAADKREGDMATPIGDWPLRHLYYRPDQLEAPDCALPTCPLTPELGWCDDPSSAAYNQLIKLPFAASHETLWRADRRYDLLVVLGHNDNPPVPNMGSAIFLHLCDDDTKFTAGCVAVKLDDLKQILHKAGPETVLRITG